MCKAHYVGGIPPLELRAILIQLLRTAMITFVVFASLGCMCLGALLMVIEVMDISSLQLYDMLLRGS